MEAVSTQAAVVSADASEQITIDKLVEMYKKQSRECWLCEKVLKDIEAGKEISEDSKWHLTSCVLSWEHIHRL